MGDDILSQEANNEFREFNNAKVENNNQVVNGQIDTIENGSNGYFSKKCKILISFVLISTFIIYFDNFIKSMDWWWNLRVRASITGDDQLKLALETFEELIVAINWTIVVLITILSIIFLIIDKKKKTNVNVYEWYIVAGIMHILIGTVGLTPIIFSVVTLIFVFKNRKYNKANNLSTKSDNALIILSSILSISIITGEINLFLQNLINFDKV